MREIIITANDSGRRLDRFLRKYLRHASLGDIYKIIRKDVKVGGRRKDESYILAEGDVLSLYLSDEVIDSLTADARSSKAGSANSKKAKRQFRIIYEDSNILIADKPYGLLTHGDSHEKKNHLANQVRDYLIEKGDYDPRSEKVFSPAPANRLDRNTTGLVLFGKNSAALKALGAMIREDRVDKYYYTLVHGILDKEMTLTGSLTKDERANKVSVQGSAGDPGALDIVTIVRPLRYYSFGDGGRDFRATLAEVNLVTGRSHQIRAHLASIGHPVIGDVKYQTASVRRANEYAASKFRLTTQLLHAYRIVFKDAGPELDYLTGKSFTAPLPPAFEKILSSMHTLRQSGNK